MSTPRIPDSTRNWDAIDIYLFTNGQQNSPPRKYHLKSEELKWWGTTLEFLARSQFGSLQSNIEIYTLDGKKVDSPLDLINDASYVAVKPPDVFVQSGYEKYLLKASRSREKRQERLNSTDMTYSPIANAEINKDQFKSNVTSPSGKTIMKTLEESIILYGEKAASDTSTFTQSQKDVENLQKVQTISNPLKSEKPEFLQRRKPGNFARNTIPKKNISKFKNQDDGQNLSKKKNAFNKNFIKSSNNNKKLTISSNNTTILKANLVQNDELKPKNNITETIDNRAEIEQRDEQSINDPKMKTSLLGIYGKGLMVLSDVTKTTENNINSDLLDADGKRSLLIINQAKQPQALDNVEKFEETPKNILKTDRETFKQPPVDLYEVKIKDNILNQPSTFNLNLNIDIKGCTVLKTPGKDTSNCKSHSQASQVNLDVNLGSNTFNFGDNVFVQGQSAECMQVREDTCNIADNSTKLIVIRCRCNVLNSDNNNLSTCYYNEHDNFIFLIPSQMNDKIMQSGDLETQQTYKDVQKSLHTYNRVPTTINSEVVYNKKPENVGKQKVTKLSHETPTELRDVQTIINEDKSIYKTDNFVQTDWCNILIQAKCHQDGRYSFHLPALQLLAHYNLL